MAARKWNKLGRREEEMAEMEATRAWEEEAVLIRAKAAETHIQARVEEDRAADGVEARTSRETWTRGQCGI